MLDKKFHLFLFIFKASAEERHGKEEERLGEKIKDFFATDKITSLSDLRKKIASIHLPEKITIKEHDQSLLFLQVLWEEDDVVPSIAYALQVKEDLSVRIAVGGTCVKEEAVGHLLEGGKVTAASSVGNILAQLKSMTTEKKSLTESAISICAEKIGEFCTATSSSGKKLLFLREQLLLALSSIHSRRFSSDLLAAATIWKMVSPSLYKQLLSDGLLTLPSMSHLQNLSRPLSLDSGSDSLCYLKNRAEKLSEQEKLVVLLIDEIYNAQRVEYCGGKLYGVDKESGCVNKTLLSFMIKSVAGQYCDVVSLVPCSHLDSAFLLCEFEKVIQLLSKTDFRVVAISVDNATPNRKFYVHELGKGNLPVSVQHPLQATPLHLLFDSTHNFKNAYNNFQTRKTFKLPPFPGEGEETFFADFSHIEALFQKELGKPVKMAHKLSEKVLHPTSIEKTNVSLADALFHESTISALTYYSEEFPEWKETAKFLQIIRNWWNISNVKTLFHGQKKRNPFLAPITSEDCENVKYLKKFSAWILSWKESCKGKDGKKLGLSSETFLAVKQTTDALSALASYLLKEGLLSYILTGHLQSDSLEKRFGWYRQLGVSNYFISVRQILEAEKSIRLRSLVKFSGYSLGEIKEQFEEETAKKTEELRKECSHLLDLLRQDTSAMKQETLEDKNILFYIGGHLAFSLEKSTSCSSCASMLKEEKEMQVQFEDDETEKQSRKEAKVFLEQINRGGLSYPSDIVYVSCLHIWSLFCDVQKNAAAKEALFHSQNPRQLFSEVFLQLCLENDDLSGLLAATCSSGHSFKGLLEKMTKKLFNMFAKNKCRELNDAQRKGGKHKSQNSNPSGAKIRKLQSE